LAAPTADAYYRVEGLVRESVEGLAEAKRGLKAAVRSNTGALTVAARFAFEDPSRIL